MLCANPKLETFILLTVAQLVSFLAGNGFTHLMKLATITNKNLFFLQVVGKGPTKIKL